MAATPSVTPHTIPLLHFDGSYRDVGRQIGEACGDVIERAVAFEQELPSGRTRAVYRALRGAKA